MTRLFASELDRADHIHSLYGAAMPLFIAESAAHHAGLTLVVTDSSAQAQRLAYEISALLPQEVPLLEFPDWETLPYDPFSAHRDIISQRIETLYTLPSLKRGLLMLPMSTLMQRVAPASFVSGHALMLARGQQLDREALLQRLVDAGYRRADQVFEHGEFAVRGSLLDLFPMASQYPFRIDFFDEEIDEIRSFDVDSQRSIETLERIELLPAREFPTDEEAIRRFKRRFREEFDEFAPQTPLYREVGHGHIPAGIEYYQPLFHEQMATLHDYLPDNARVLAVDQALSAAEAHWQQIQQRYEQLRHDRQRPILAPPRLFLDPDEARSRLRNWPLVQLDSHAQEHCGHSADTRAGQRFALQPRSERPLGQLQDFIASYTGRILFTAASPGRRESMLELLRSNHVDVRTVSDLRQFVAGDMPLALCELPLEEGVELRQRQLMLISEQQLLGERAPQARRRKSHHRAADAIISNLADLRPGAPVVHSDHGVGRYLGLQTLDIGEVATEFLTLEYADGAKLYVPVANLHLISRYTGADMDNAPLHRLGSEQWSKAKRKAAEQARDVAAELLEIHARRKARKGEALSFDAASYAAFANSFPFEETPDQASAIASVVHDLSAPHSMDRIVCGDVGFGKTEVAMRAAFVAADAGKQVAVLVPTTLLAQQHYENFLDRFADWPIQIESVSRFRGKKQQEAALEKLREGKIDIVIGTHRLLQKDVKFKRLGLLIIDEEHRFGVRDKEHFKRLRAEVDILTLTATPIPRTLNMSLAGIRDLSIIATPPAQRQAIKTFVSEWNDAMLREACQRELARGGQIYFLHNEVKTIERMAEQLRELMPNISIGIAHGQMRESELERVMLDFYHQRFNLLLASTIIESGIDVPNANTIIIHRADRLGLAQLHQLRGRVGRSHHRAYAYLLIPPRKALTPEADKRLSAIESLEDLGAGFMLATHDLEIRGAGALLGDSQTGQIQQIGFTLYSELLDRAVKAFQQGKIPDLEADDPQQCEIDIHLPALLPEDYVPDVHNRLVLYKRLSGAEDTQALHDLNVELIDRFGLLPEAAKTLMAVQQIRLRLQALGIRKLDATASGLRMSFSAQTRVDPGRIIELVQKQPTRYRLSDATTLIVTQASEDRDSRVALIEDVLNAIAPDS